MRWKNGGPIRLYVVCDNETGEATARQTLRDARALRDARGHENVYIIAYVQGNIQADRARKGDV